MNENFYFIFSHLQLEEKLRESEREKSRRRRRVSTVKITQKTTCLLKFVQDFKYFMKMELLQINFKLF